MDSTTSSVSSALSNTHLQATILNFVKSHIPHQNYIRWIANFGEDTLRKNFSMAVLTVNFYLWKVNSNIWHRCSTSVHNFMKIRLFLFEKSQQVSWTNEQTNQQTNLLNHNTSRRLLEDITISQATHIPIKTHHQHTQRTNNTGHVSEQKHCLVLMITK